MQISSKKNQEIKLIKFIVEEIYGRLKIKIFHNLFYIYYLEYL